MKFEHLLTAEHARDELQKLQNAANYNAASVLKELMRKRGWPLTPPPKVSPLTLFRRNIPAVLKAEPRWSVWKKLEDGRKIPYRVLDGGFWSQTQRCKCNTPSMWVSFDKALECLKNANGHLGGLVFALGGRWMGFDFDDVIVNGILHVKAKSWLQQLGGYQEISQSVKGVKVVLPGKLSETFLGTAKTGRQFKGIPAPGMATEVYHCNRFFFLTGNGAGEPLENQQTIDAICRELLALKTQSAPKPQRRHQKRTTAATLQFSDDVILQKIRASRQAVKFEMLWNGQIGTYDSASEADLALTTILMWWCNNDASQVERIFEKSALAQRPKWNREDYRARTLAKAEKSDGYHTPQVARDYGNAAQRIKERLNHATK